MTKLTAGTAGDERVESGPKLRSACVSRALLGVSPNRFSKTSHFLIAAALGFLSASSQSFAQAENEAAAAETPLTEEEEMADERFSDTLDSWMRWGPVTLRPGISYSVAYSDNIFERSGGVAGRSKDDVIHRIAPDISLTVTDLSNSEILFPEIGYTPEIVLYHDNDDLNTVNHEGRLEFEKILPKTTLNLSHISSSRQDAVAEIATVEKTQSHITVFSADYEYSGKTLLESETSQTIQDRETGSSLMEWEQQFWAGYAVLPKVDLSLGIGGGYSSLDPGFDSFFQTDQVRVRYAPTAKLKLELRGGIEWRTIRDSGGEDRIDPLAGLFLTYEAPRDTIVTLSLEHRTQSSIYIANQLGTYSTVALSLRKNFLDRWYGDITGSYSTVDTETTGVGPTTNTSYDFYQARLAVGYNWTRRTTSSAYYTRLARSGGGGLGSVKANEIGLNLAYHF